MNWQKLWPAPGPKRIALITVLALLGVYVLFAIFVAVPNGTKVHVYLDVGTNDDGSMVVRCDTARSKPGSCTPGEQTVITVGQRDRVTMTVHSLDGGGRAHDFKLLGGAYAVPPAGIEMELHKATQTKSFTAWKAGEFRIVCELRGHERAGMYATLVVE